MTFQQIENNSKGMIAQIQARVVTFTISECEGYADKTFIDYLNQEITVVVCSAILQQIGFRAIDILTNTDHKLSVDQVIAVCEFVKANGDLLKELAYIDRPYKGN